MSSVNDIIDFYNESMDEISRCKNPGQIRSKKGNLVEGIAEMIILCAWRNIGGEQIGVLSFIPPSGENKSVMVPMKAHYDLAWFDEKYDRKEFSRIWGVSDLTDSFYRHKVDKHVYINGKFVLGVECKSYAENAMLKRILLDFYLLKLIDRNIGCCLLQLESQLGGENEIPGSNVMNLSSLTLMSHFDNVNLEIITLLEGSRKVTEPIHESEHFKELKHDFLNFAIKQMEKLLLRHLRN